MDIIKETNQDFIDDFKRKLKARHDEFLALGIDMDNKDIALVLDSIATYITNNPTDETVLPFYKENLAVMGDIYHSSPTIKARNPWTYTLTYKGHAVSQHSFGQEIYSDVYNRIDKIHHRNMDNLLIPINIVSKYLEGETSARTALMNEMNFLNYRNWEIIWAKLDWIRLCFPKCYEKMMADGEFMSVEELEDKIKEIK